MTYSFLRAGFKRTLLGCATIALLSGCSGNLEVRHQRAEIIAQNAQLERRDIAASPFILASWQRMSVPQAPVNIYIEGDGLAWMSRRSPSHNPTPKNPVGLTLAAADPARNVVYFARPCQYTALNAQNNQCAQMYWTNKRFAPEVLESYHAALNILVKKGYTGGFHLIGYSGGANIAGLLAASRQDILSFRSVAGNLDNDFFIHVHEVSAMPLSLNMANSAKRLAEIPQRHFIGEQDHVIPSKIFESYARKVGETTCLSSAVIQGTTHITGWEEEWPELLKVTPRCMSKEQ